MKILFTREYFREFLQHKHVYETRNPVPEKRYPEVFPNKDQASLKSLKEEATDIQQGLNSNSLKPELSLASRKYSTTDHPSTTVLND